MANERVAVRGSERTPVPEATPVGSPNPTDLVTVTVLVKNRHPVPDPGPHIITRAEFAQRYGATDADISAVAQFAEQFDLTVGEVNVARRSIVLIGTVANMNEAFGTQLQLFQSSQGLFRGRVGQLFIPAELGEVIVGVFGLDDRPQARTRLRRHIEVGPRAAGDTSYTPNQVANLYSFPTSGNGAGQTVAIIELGGGFTQADLTAYFGKLGIKVPNVTSVAVDGGLNQPAGDPNSADGEVLLDIEVIGAIAPGAKLVVYFAPNTDQGFLDAISTAVHDSLRKPSVVSISWGGPESSWTQQSLTSFDQAFKEAGVLGVTVCCASGDDGSADGVTDGAAHVDFPSSSPNVLACGGTRLESLGKAITKEVVWNHGAGNGASGGGVSETFAIPSYQSQAKVPVSVNPTHFKGRGVPDVSGDADPATGYQIHVDGRDAVFGGTSAVAPLWSALIALINQKRGHPVGFMNPTLYGASKTQKALNDITSGNNGAYTAGTGWDACTGLGSPNGAKVLLLFTAVSTSRDETVST